MLTNPKASLTKHFTPGLSCLLAGYSQPAAVGLLTRDVRQPKTPKQLTYVAKLASKLEELEQQPWDHLTQTYIIHTVK